MLCLLNSAFFPFSLTDFSFFISFNVDMSPLILHILRSIFFFHFGWLGFRSLPFSFVFKPNDSVTAEAVAYIRWLTSVRESFPGSSFIWSMALFAVSIAFFALCAFWIFGIGGLWFIGVSMAISYLWRLLSFMTFTVPFCASMFSYVQLLLLCMIMTVIMIVPTIVGLHPVFELLVGLVFLASSTFLKFPLFQEKQRFAEVL